MPLVLEKRGGKIATLSKKAAQHLKRPQATSIVSPYGDQLPTNNLNKRAANYSNQGMIGSEKRDSSLDRSTDRFFKTRGNLSMPKTSNKKTAASNGPVNKYPDKFVGSHMQMAALQRLDQPVNVIYKQHSKTPLLKKSGKKSNMNVHDPAMPPANGEGSAPVHEQMIKTLEQGRHVEDFGEQMRRHQAKIGNNMP